MSDTTHEKVVIERKNGKLAVLTLQPFETDINVDDILRIDYGNIMGEILTFPLIFNRIANLKAELDNIVADSKIDVEIFEAQLRQEYRHSMIAASQKPTIDTVNDAVLMDTRYKVKKNYHSKLLKDAAYLDALYWSAQSKDSKLNRISEKIRPEEFEKDLIEETINGIMIKMARKVL